MADAGGDEQALVAIKAVLLVGQQLAAGEVVGGFGRYTQQDFGGFGGEPDVVLGADVFQMLLLWRKAAGGVNAQAVDQCNAEVFQPLRFHGGQVPNAVFVDEAIGLGLPGLAFVGKAAFVALLDGRLQLGKALVVAGQAFLRHGLHVQRALPGGDFELLQQVAQAAVGEELAGAGHVGVFVQRAGGDGAARMGPQRPALAFGVVGDVAKALIEIALDGAHIDAEALGQLVFVDLFALVQPGKDVGQALGQHFAFVARLGATGGWGS